MKWVKPASTEGADIQNNIVYSTSLVNDETQLLIHKGDSNVLVKNWNSGQLGINLGASAPLVSPATALTGTATGNYLNSVDTGSRKVDGQAGKDMIWGAIAADQLYGGDGDDWIMGNLGADRIEGGLGNDYITGLGDGAEVKGGAGNDTYLNVTGEDSLFDIEGDNRIQQAAATGIGAGGLSVVNTGDQGQYRKLNIALYAAYAQTDSAVSNAENDEAWKEAA